MPPATTTPAWARQRRPCGCQPDHRLVWVAPDLSTARCACGYAGQMRAVAIHVQTSEDR